MFESLARRLKRSAIGLQIAWFGVFAWVGVACYGRRVGVLETRPRRYARPSPSADPGQTLYMSHMGMGV